MDRDRGPGGASGGERWSCSAPAGANRRSTSSRPRCYGPQGAGPTVIVSPLLALMRNQIAAAERAAHQRRDHQLDQRRGVGGDLRRGESRRDRRAAAVARAAEQPGVPRPGAAAAGGDLRPARRRRGALHQRLGPRLPARLPPAAHPAAASCRRVSRCWPPPPPPTPGSSPTWPRCSSLGQRGSDVLVLRGPLDRESLRLACWRCPRPRTGWPGWPTISPRCPARASSTR